eukprot:TRINITY_DN388_c0_g1_i2.p1 TRINITY_DN388_c0_g1~~TRINITY_DN388_c0_g1_i2.p1  ORF type:complete len:677 (+),score=216.59 TRINITY_DN388_c0_g1_i2:226-2256(+)
MENTQLYRLLNYAFRVLENEFATLDRDDTGTVSYAQFQRSMTTRGFQRVDELQSLFRDFDTDGSGTLDFKEFLQLVFYWRSVAPYSALFPSTDAKVIEDAFKFLGQAYAAYDTDNSRSLSRDEIMKFVQEYFETVPSDFNARVDAISHRDRPNAISVPRFLIFLYNLTHPTGKYTEGAGSRSTANNNAAYTGSGSGMESTELWFLLSKMFGTLEHDFKRFDADNDNCIDASELTAGLQAANEGLLVDLVARVQRLLDAVDLDQSGTIDFMEFMYLVYLLVEEGSYRDIVEDTRGARDVKRGMQFLRKAYSKYDADNSMRLDKQETSNFVRDYFGEVPSSFDPAFDKNMNASKGTIDFVHFLNMLYAIVSKSEEVEGTYVDKKKTERKRKVDMLKSRVPAGTGKHKLERVSNLDLREIKKGKQLGKGGFGVAFKAEFRGNVVAAKYLHGDYNREVHEEFDKEVKIMEIMDHPNLLYLVGSKAEPPTLCIVTEFCGKGSLFDVIQKQRSQLHPSLVFKIAYEIALGMADLHAKKPPVLHRDLKSLNVFLDDDYNVKVADFGMSKRITGQIQSMNMCGSILWMAPEVIQSPKYDLAADVYSYAIMLWEITHGRLPYEDFRGTDMQLAMNVVHGTRPRISSKCPRAMADIMRKCWDGNAAKRPSFAEVVKLLDAARDEFF